MTEWLPVESYKGRQDIAQQQLGECLQDGSLCLFVGAGVSFGMGLPSWDDLVHGCVNNSPAETQVSPPTTPEEFLNAIDDVERSYTEFSGYSELVRTELYSRIADERSLLDQKTLVALGAMTMSSRRGSINEIVTFNFDDVLERYLRIHGFTNQVIHSLPQLRDNSDVTVYHPHGFLSQHDTERSSDFLVFSKHSFDKRIGARVDPWKDLVRDLLLRKIAIFVGVSQKGPNFGPMMTDVAEGLKGAGRPTGFWVLGPDDDERCENELHTWNVIPIRVESYDNIPWFLLGICQAAAGNSW
ncbi:MAG: SIR2 family protein [Rhodopirellula sp.]|nr:SIR2 family protein [Rhodopirellula sp.]